MTTDTMTGAAPGRVIAGLCVSLDGYIAGPDDTSEQPLGTGGSRLFDWYSDGDTPSRHHPGFRLSAASAQVLDALADRIGAIITGRRTYDLVDGWDGHGPLPGAPLFVLTHVAPDPLPSSDPPYTFVATGIADAVQLARTAAGGRDVGLMGSSPVRQALAAGLLDEITLHLFPVLLGAGVRLLGGLPAGLRCTAVVAAPGVTHLTYQPTGDP